MRTLTVAHWAASRATNVEHLFPAKSMELAWPARRAGKTVRELCASSLPGSDPGFVLAERSRLGGRDGLKQALRAGGN